MIGVINKVGCPILPVLFGDGTTRDRQDAPRSSAPGGWPTFGFVVCRERHDLRLPHLSRFSKGGLLRTQIPCSFVTARTITRMVEVDHASTGAGPPYGFVVCRDHHDLRLPHLSRFSKGGLLRTQIPCSFVTARTITRTVEVDHDSTRRKPNFVFAKSPDTIGKGATLRKSRTVGQPRF